MAIIAEMRTKQEPISNLSQTSSGEFSFVEVSIVIPCLNEADTLGVCIEKAHRALRDSGISGEIIVADNGSTDRSQTIATKMGARVINVEAKGYGNALMGGIAAARGKYIIMGDADDSYDFLEVPKFVTKLREGYDLVQGCRLPAGGGRVMPGAMPFSHKLLGNPLFSRMARSMFNVPVHDVYCGLRGFVKNFYSRLDQRCTGMEFATEMIIKASIYGYKITEEPITLHRDGRKSHTSHLKTFRDGWRTLRFFLMYSPRWLFLIPGVILVVLGMIGYGLALPGLSVINVHFDAHTLVFASLSVLLGYQSIVFAVFTKTFAIGAGLLPEDRIMTRFFELANLERGLIVGLVVFLIGIALLTLAINQWRLTQFGNLDYAQTMRLVIPGATLSALGFQTILSSFLVSILGMHRK
jgi:glycosyltransferase involved in cell wall biosynthesis